MSGSTAGHFVDTFKGINDFFFVNLFPSITFLTVDIDSISLCVETFGGKAILFSSVCIVQFILRNS